MKQQGQKIVVKPAKSHSARNFFKQAIKERQETKRFNTLHTQPVEPKSLNKPNTERVNSRSYRQFSSRIQQMTVRPPEELAEQNWKLKGKVNRLTQQLLKEKVKRTQETRHFLKMQKEVEVQFEDDKYLDLSRQQNKLIEGVKHQYKKMKQKYEDKCMEYNQLLRRFDISVGQEMRFECECLHVQNKKLKEKISLLISTQERISEEYQKQVIMRVKGSSPYDKEKRQQTTLDLLGFASTFITLEKQVADLTSKNSNLTLKIDRLKQTIEQKSHKINFLDKLIIEKSNQNHHLIMSQRKISKQNKMLQIDLVELRKRAEKGEEERHSELELVKQKEKIKFETERSIFLRSLRDKDLQIDKLSSQLKYVTTLISYIKTGDDQIIQNHFNPLSKKQSHKEKSQEVLFNLEKSLTQLQGHDMRERVKSFFESGRKEPQTNSKIISNTQTLRKTLLKSEAEGIGYSHQGSECSEEEDEIFQSRLVKKSYLKHSPGCSKVKPIKAGQLQVFRLQLVYRFIFYKLSADAAKEYLSFKPSPENEANLSKREQRWRVKYITFKQARTKLLHYPFELQPEYATLFARYMIEDQTREDFFFHEDNQIQRTIAKSILRAFVGEYLIPDQSQAKEQIKEVLAKSGKNLRSALTSLAPNGEISHLKFIEISRGINVDFSEKTQNYIISQLASKSIGGLNKLLYDKLFDQ